METLWTAYVQLPHCTVMVVPGDVPKAVAQRQLDNFIRFIQPFPGATQEVCGWMEPTK